MRVTKTHYSNFNNFVKSRHSGEGRNPEILQGLENTGSRPSPGWRKKGIFDFLRNCQLSSAQPPWPAQSL